MIDGGQEKAQNHGLCKNHAAQVYMKFISPIAHAALTTSMV